jgi:hypothetical protein
MPNCKKLCSRSKALKCAHCYEDRNQVVRDALNILGGPVMSYAPEVALKEYQERIKKASEMLQLLLKA